MAVTPPKKGRGWDLANTNIQEWIKLFQGVGVMKVYISRAEGEVQRRVVLSARSSDHMLGATTISLAV
jgi:hypothetical protein